MDCVTCNKPIEDEMLNFGSVLCENCFDAEYQDYLESVKEGA